MDDDVTAAAVVEFCFVGGGVEVDLASAGDAGIADFEFVSDAGIVAVGLGAGIEFVCEVGIVLLTTDAGFELVSTGFAFGVEVGTVIEVLGKALAKSWLALEICVERVRL